MTPTKSEPFAIATRSTAPRDGDPPGRPSSRRSDPRACSTREKIIRRLEGAGLADRTRAVAETAFFLRAAITRRDRRLAAGYLAETARPKLHIGCGTNILPGWLNADAIPLGHDVVHLDATRRFPYPSAAFYRVFSEHMIEHVAFAKAQTMLAECFRVLAPGGTVRISTPDLGFLVALHAPRRSALQDDYVEWTRRSWLRGPGREQPDPTASVINHFVRAWGHLFIYDEATLGWCLERAGFIDVARRPILESPHPGLQGLENVARAPDGFIALESLSMEGTKPAADSGS